MTASEGIREIQKVLDIPKMNFFHRFKLIQEIINDVELDR